MEEPPMSSKASAYLWKQFARHAAGKFPLRGDQEITAALNDLERRAVQLSRDRPHDTVVARAYWRHQWGERVLARIGLTYGEGGAWPPPPYGKVEVIGRWLEGERVEG
jgi:hypothetical protein